MRNLYGSRGDVWLVNLEPTVASEIQQTLPCAMVSPSEMHDHLRTVLAAKDGLVLLDQIRALDKTLGKEYGRPALLR